MPPKKKVGDDDAIPMLGRPGNRIKMGIVGLPNVGKSTFFNVLTKLNVAAENYPFCTIDPNEATVPVPDQRFNWLVKKYAPKSVVPGVLGVTDIAGLIAGASEGAGLGNAFLSHIGATDGIYHMLRGFESEDIIHVDGEVDPVRDIAVITGELLAKDISLVSGLIAKMESNPRQLKMGGKEAEAELACYKAYEAYMTDAAGPRQVRFGRWSAIEVEYLNKLNLLTAKPMAYLINLSDKMYSTWLSSGGKKGSKWLPLVMAKVKEVDPDAVLIPWSGEFEEKYLDMETNGGLEDFKKANPGVDSALPKIIKVGYKTLKLIHYFTSGADEVRAWTIRQGRTAPQAAGVIHTDFEKGFIKAEVMKFKDLKEAGDEAKCAAAGKKRMEGKTYVVNDGDIMFFKFNT